MYPFSSKIPNRPFYTPGARAPFLTAHSRCFFKRNIHTIVSFSFRSFDRTDPSGCNPWHAGPRGNGERGKPWEKREGRRVSPVAIVIGQFRDAWGRKVWLCPALVSAERLLGPAERNRWPEFETLSARLSLRPRLWNPSSPGQRIRHRDMWPRGFQVISIVLE